MDLTNLKEFYNRIDQCSVKIATDDIGFEYIQTQIGKTSHYTEELNRALGEILMAITEHEHQITTAEFAYELNVTNLTTSNAQVQTLSTGKERLQYINYVLLKVDFESLTNLKQELKDLQALLKFTEKKSKDLDRVYPKLKTLWDSFQSELKNIKNVGSDDKYIDQVRNSIQDDNSQRKPLFLDSSVEQLKAEQYNEKEDEEETSDSKHDTDRCVDSLLSDL